MIQFIRWDRQNDDKCNLNLLFFFFPTHFVYKVHSIINSLCAGHKRESYERRPLNVVVGYKLFEYWYI